MLNVSSKTIYRWINEREIPAYKINEHFRFNRTELLEWAISQRIQVSPNVFQKENHDNRLSQSFVNALRVGGISYRVGGIDQPSVLRAVVDLLKLPEEVDREFLYQVLLARETLGSTGIGDGIAIPHVRNPVVLHISKPSVALCFLDHPIDFHAIDGKPVNTLFTLISPTVREHLQMLSRLGFLLRNQDFKAALKRQDSPDVLLEALTRAEAVIPNNDADNK
jgi:PTS system nitrogen regulatory IIA component